MAMTLASSPMRSILSLDLGTTTGWALRSRDGSIVSGSQSFKPQRFEGGGMRYLRHTARARRQTDTLGRA